MKRVLAACFFQTLHFQLKEDIPHDMAVRLVREEVERYKDSLSKKAFSTRSILKQNSPTVPLS